MSWTFSSAAAAITAVPINPQVTAPSFDSITVTAPTGTTAAKQGDALPVTWTTNADVASGQFSIWVVSPANGWYVGKIHAADGTHSYADSVDLNVPADTGYSVYVYYRATSNDPWGIYGSARGRSTWAPSSAPSRSPRPPAPPPPSRATPCR